jgi:hypothetical protein
VRTLWRYEWPLVIAARGAVRELRMMSPLFHYFLFCRHSAKGSYSDVVSDMVRSPVIKSCDIVRRAAPNNAAQKPNDGTAVRSSVVLSRRKIAGERCEIDRLAHRVTLGGSTGLVWYGEEAAQSIRKAGPRSADVVIQRDE